jgi:hypothetical protein
MHAKPSLPQTVPVNFSILFRVRDALVKAGCEGLADEFLRRAAACQCCEQVARVAEDYVQFPSTLH